MITCDVGEVKLNLMESIDPGGHVVLHQNSLLITVKPLVNKSNFR